MATAKVWTDLQGRQITQWAYNAQKKAGTDVSKYTKIGTPVTPAVTTPTVTPTVTPDTSTVSSDNLDLWGGKSISKQWASYKALIGKWYTDQTIVDYYNKVKKPTTTETPAVVPDTTTNTETTTVIPTPEWWTATTKETTTPLSPMPTSEYQDNSQDRLNQIVDNLNNYRTTAPQYMTNQETFRNTFSYWLRSNEQKQLLDNWYSGYTKGLGLSNKTDNDLMTMYTNKTLTDGDLELIRLQNPNKYNAVKELIDKKNKLTTYANELYGEDTPTLISQTNPLWDVATDTDFFEEYRNVVNGEEATALSTQINDKQEQIDQLNLEMLKIQKDVEKEYEWTGATSSKIAAIVSDRQTDIQNKLSKLSIEGNTMINKYNSLVNTAKEVMQSQIDEQNYINTQRTQKMQELGFYYQYTPQGMSEMATAKYNAENPDMDSKDINTSKRALNQTLTEYYKDYKDIIIRPQARALDDIMKYAKDNNMSVSQALKENFIAPLQWKSEYKSMVAKKYGTETNRSLVDIWWTQYLIDGQWNLTLPKTVANLTGSALMQTLASGNYNGNKFFWVYATWDPTWVNRAKLYNQVATQWVAGTLAKYSWTPITEEMINNAASTYWVDPLMIATLMAADSSMWTKGKAVRTMNPWNVWNTDSWWTVTFWSWQEWVNAVAKNLQSRMNALAKSTGTAINWLWTNETKTEVDETSNSLLSSTWLSIDAFAYLTKWNSVLSRLSEATRQKIKTEAQQFLSKNWVDISTFQSQYSAISSAVERTVKIQSNVQRDEIEIKWTLEALQQSVQEADLWKIKKANLVKIALWEETNSPFATKYWFLLSTLREEIAGYYAALRWDNLPNESDSTRSANVIANGISSWWLKWLQQWFEQNVKKLAANLPTQIENLNNQVWRLFWIDKWANSSTTPTWRLDTITQPITTGYSDYPF